ncbi:MAG: AIM24 family protein, partial [Anaerolineae bacterium]|nr:AIM24 family protein [Anaerolineae bacterium]
ILGGEGFVCNLTGPGRVFLQSRSEEAFLGWLIPKLPSRSSN